MRTAIYQQKINENKILIATSETMPLEYVFNSIADCENFAKKYGFGDTVMFWAVDLDNPDTVLVPPCLN